MHRLYAPTTEDIDNFRFAASARLSDLLHGDIDLDAVFGDFDDCTDAGMEFPHVA